MSDPKILVLCHGGRWVLTADCPTMGVPITPDAIATMTFVSSIARSHPHVVADWTKPTRLPPHKFDVVTTACCGFDTFIDADTGALRPTAFHNVVRVLKPGGFFVFTTAPMGIRAFAAHVRHPLPSSPLGRDIQSWIEKPVLRRLASEIQSHHPTLVNVSNTSHIVRRWSRALARRFDDNHTVRNDLLVFRRA